MSIPDLEEPQQEVVLDDDAVEARSDDENRDNLLALEPDEEAIERVQKQPPRYASLEDFHFLPTELKCITDGGPGCGGHIWQSAVVLTRYLHHSISVDAKRWQNKTAVELGAGTGIVACALGLLNVPGLDIYSTDLDILLPLARKNVELNGLQDVVKVAALPWGEPLPSDVPHKPDLLLLADCIYLEPTFPWLVQTLRLMCTEETEVLLCYKKRRKADKRFFVLLKQYFTFDHVTDDPHKSSYDREGLFLYSVKLKPGKGL